MKRVRRAFFVSQWFPPEPAAQAFRIANTLRSLGYETEVLTGIPNYPSGEVAEGYSATSLMSEDILGLRVHRTPLYPSHDASALRRIANYVSWAVSASVLAAWRLRTADVVVVYSSPATAALPAMVANRLFRRRYVLIVQDVWPDSVLSSGMLGGAAFKIARLLIHAFANASYRWASAIVVISPGMSDLLSRRGVPAHKLTLVYNSVDGTAQLPIAKSPMSRQRLGIRDSDFVLMYAGNHGAAQGLDAILLGVAAVEDPRVHLVMVGDGVAKAELVSLADQLAPARIHFVEAQPREEIASLMALADVQVVSLADHPLFKVTMPSKVQGIMASGHALLAVASGDVAGLMATARCGVSARPGDAQDVARAIAELASTAGDDLELMGERGRAYYDEYMAEAVGRIRLQHVLDSVTAPIG